MWVHRVGGGAGWKANPTPEWRNEPTACRDVLAHELLRLRPGLQVHLVEPNELDDAVLALRPAFVITSHASVTVRRWVRATLVLYPEGRDEAIVAIAEG